MNPTFKVVGQYLVADRKEVVYVDGKDESAFDAIYNLVRNERMGIAGGLF